jgi:iron complex transport system permease protein
MVWLLGARTMRQRLFWAPVMGAILLWLTDQCVQHLPLFHSEIPTGSATAAVGAPILLLILLRHQGHDPGGVLSASVVHRRATRPVMLIALLVALFVLFTALAVGLGETPIGWQWISPETADFVLPWRLPRVVAAGSAGTMLAVAGLLLQRLTGNPMASPEVLGISSGAALGVIILLFFIPGFSQMLMIAAACGGALAALFFVMILNWRSDFSSGRLLLVGVALATVFSALAAVLLTSGDPRSAVLLTWMSGSTYRVSWPGAQVAALAAIVLVVATCSTLRWLEIIPLGVTVSRSIGTHALASRLVIVSLTAVLTAAATLVVGPLSFVGLMGPHIVRALGIHRPLEQIIGAAVVGGTLMIAADWIGRNIFFPWQAPAGLLAALIGGPLYLWLLRRRTA